MQMSRPGTSPEGYPIIGLAAFFALLFAIFGWPWLSTIFVLLGLFSLYFFRDPVRYPPEDPDAVISAADGKVCCVDRAMDLLTGLERQRIGVFMNVFNVHVNRAPIAGTVQRVVYRPGKFFNASFDKASEHNERLSLSLVSAANEQFTVVQIAGLVARRIVCRAEAGDQLPLGARFGCIMFGSRVDVYLPSDYEIVLLNGDKVVAGETVLARRKTE